MGYWKETAITETNDLMTIGKKWKKISVKIELKSKQ